MNSYYKLLGDLPDGDYEACVAFLTQELGYGLTEAYEEEFAGAQIVRFNDTLRRAYTIFFDLTQDEGADIYGRAARAVWVHGRSAPAIAERDHGRMRGFLGAFKNQPQYMDYDKGHFVAHCNDGQVDQNLYPQLKELNRGLSPQGKLFRSMERYLQKNEGVFYFFRPIYNDLTWIPDQIDFGVFTKEKGLLLNRFDNRKRSV
jgi:hypothetical protein